VITINPESSAHWYTADGKPQHDATLREARKQRLYPSVTTIQKVFAKPGLDAWKLQQAILSALTLPRNPGESDDDFASRVVKDMGEETKQAANRGTIIHDMINHRLVNGVWPAPLVEKHMLAPWTMVLETWINRNVKKVYISEKVVVHPSGYAGTVDLVAETAWAEGPVVIDFKNQRVADGKKPKFYPEYCAQLAAYRQALGTPQMMEKYSLPSAPVATASVVINREKPEPPYVNHWGPEETVTQLEMFWLAHRAWSLSKNYHI